MRFAAVLLSAVLCNAQEARDAASLLSEAANRVRTAKTWLIEGRSTVENGTGGESAGAFKLAWRAPGLARYESDSGRALVVCDGSTAWTYFPRANHYTRIAVNKVEQPAEDVGSLGTSGISGCGFFLSDWVNLTNGLASAALVGHSAVELEGQSRTCDLVMAEYPADDKSRRGHRSRLLCIDPDTRLILRKRVETDYPAVGKVPQVYRVQTMTLSTIRRDPELQPGLFTFVPPEGSTTNDSAPSDPRRVYAVGEGITPPLLIERRDPEYPKKAVKAGIEGSVLLDIEVAPDGKAHNIRVLRSLDPELDRKAVECVAGWKFRPGTKDGQRVTVSATVEVNFRIER